MHGQELKIGNLPEDPAPTASLKTVQIKKGDYRKGLVPHQVGAGPCTYSTHSVSGLGFQHTCPPFVADNWYIPGSIWAPHTCYQHMGMLACKQRYQLHL